MASIRVIDMKLIEDAFEMQGGYVLDFNNRTFSDFFQRDLRINIDDQRFLADGTSKAKRLRCFLRTVQDQTAARTLAGLWEYRQRLRQRSTASDIPNLEEDFGDLIERLGGSRPAPRATNNAPKVSSFNPLTLKELVKEFLSVSTQTEQRRGYSFEPWLKSLFDAYGLKGRGSFRLVGEQIDGSFECQSETYLLEARWRNKKADIGDLHAFHGKLEQKAFWSRGLFVSMAGFSEDGLTAFGRGKRLICMDGLDLHQMLEQGLSFEEVIGRKVRRAAETGSPLANVRDLF